MTPNRAKTILAMVALATETGLRTRHRSFIRCICRGVGASFRIKEAEAAELLNMRLADIIILITGERAWVTNGVPPATISATAAAPSPSAPTAGRSRSDSTSI